MDKPFKKTRLLRRGFFPMLIPLIRFGSEGFFCVGVISTYRCLFAAIIYKSYNSLKKSR